MLNRIEMHFSKEGEQELIIICHYLDFSERKEVYESEGYTYKYKKVLNY